MSRQRNASPYSSQRYNSSSADYRTDRVLKIQTEMGQNPVFSAIPPSMAEGAAESYLKATEAEKKQMQSLNDRLGNYIGRVKGLETQNRKLVKDLEDMRANWSADNNEVKNILEKELTDARKQIDDEARTQSENDIKAAHLKDDVNDFRRRAEEAGRDRDRDTALAAELTKNISDSKEDAAVLRDRLKQLEDERDKHRKDNDRISDEYEKTRADLDAEALDRADLQNQVQTLMEELEFRRRVHDQEVKDLQALLQRAPTDTREFFKNEVAQAIRDISEEYDLISHQTKADMESWYKIKVTELKNASQRFQQNSDTTRDEVKRLRDSIDDAKDKLNDLENKNTTLDKQVQELRQQQTDDQRTYETAIDDKDGQLRRMRDECQMLVTELQALLDTKQMLDAEIAIYRKMLEGEETRTGLKEMVEEVVKTHAQQTKGETEAERKIKGEVQTKNVQKRSGKGNVSIADADPMGKYIVLENTHKSKEENVGEWKLRRRLDKRREIVYTIPPGSVIKAGGTMQIWARDAHGAENKPPTELIFDGEDNWGTGQEVETLLYNKDNEERSSHSQGVVQSGH